MKYAYFVEALTDELERRVDAQRALETLRAAAAREDENLMPHLIECARALATEGEIVETLQTVFGTYTETPVF